MDLDQALAALRAVWEVPLMRLLGWMAGVLQRWGRSMRMRGR